MKYPGVAAFTDVRKLAFGKKDLCSFLSVESYTIWSSVTV